MKLGSHFKANWYCFLFVSVICILIVYEILADYIGSSVGKTDSLRPGQLMNKRLIPDCCSEAVKNKVTGGVNRLKVKISLLQAVEAPRVVRGRGSHIT
jgi:hypothetical protein